MQDTCPTCGGPTCPHCGKSPYAAEPRPPWAPNVTRPWQPEDGYKGYVGDVFPNPYVVTCGTWAAVTTNTDEQYLYPNPMLPLPAVVCAYGLRSE